jgi:hypothetical protein
VARLHTFVVHLVFAIVLLRNVKFAITRFWALVPRDANVEIKPMFGNLGAFVNGNMFMGLFGFDIGVKLSPACARLAVAPSDR